MLKDLSSQVVAAYDTLGERHASRALDSVYNDYYERPVVYSLLGDVTGRRVLDAGCGPGSYAQWLVEQGATVLALDASPKMLELAEQRLLGIAKVLQVDLNQPLDFLDPGSFDVILCALTLDYIRDWHRLFGDFHRILVDGGMLVFSVHHPFFLDLKLDANVGENYFSIQQVQEDWLAFGLEIPAYRRPLGAMSSALCDSGFVIERIVEPQPIEACRDVYPKHYEQLSKHPVFLCVSAKKRT